MVIECTTKYNIKIQRFILINPPKSSSLQNIQDYPHPSPTWDNGQHSEFNLTANLDGRNEPRGNRNYNSMLRSETRKTSKTSPYTIGEVQCRTLLKNVIVIRESCSLSSFPPTLTSSPYHQTISPLNQSAHLPLRQSMKFNVNCWRELLRFC